MISTASPQSRKGIGAAVSVRRFANDEIARVGSSLDDLDEAHAFEFLCECGDPSCGEFARMTIAEYRASSPGSVVGHPVPRGVHDSAVPLPDAATLAAANAHIFRHVRDSDDGAQEWEFLCECCEEGCEEHVLLTLDAYVQLHDHGEAVLAAGHRRSQIERARALRADAEALSGQSVHQVERAKRNLRPTS